MSEKRVWFHIILTTYGAWLPGDPRGFRTRHHHELVEGDYKQPPPAGCKVVRINDRVHQQNVYNYIFDHVNEGAWVWSALRDKEAQG